MMKLKEMGVDCLETERQNTEAEILALTAKEADEESPILSALYARRANIISELNSRSFVLETV